MVRIQSTDKNGKTTTTGTMTKDAANVVLSVYNKRKPNNDNIIIEVN